VAAARDVTGKMIGKVERLVANAAIERTALMHWGLKKCQKLCGRSFLKLEIYE